MTNRSPRSGWKYLWSELKLMFFNYCETTSLHGFRHLVSNRSSFAEKCLWATICFASMILCLILMVFSYQSTQERLTLIQLTDQNNPLRSLDFPAVTICNLNVVYRPAADELSRKLKKFGYDNETIWNFFQNIPQLIRLETESRECKKFNKMLYLLSSDLKSLMIRLMQPCKKLLKSCIWMGLPYNCSILFKTVDSLLGPCCGFNYHAVSTYVEQIHSTRCSDYYKKYDSKHNLQCENYTECPGRKHILKTPGSEKDSGLSLEIDVEPAMYIGSIRDYVGAKVIIHEARAFPEIDIVSTTIQPLYEFDITVSGTTVNGLDEIKSLSHTDRKCIFHDEKDFQDYNYRSCIIGCKLRRILAACDCIPFNYPAACVNVSGLCDFKNIHCIKKYKYVILQLHEDITLDGNRTLEACKCKEPCDKVYYKIVTDRNRRTMPPSVSLLREKMYNFNFSKINIFFQNDGYTKYEIRLFMSWSDLIANLGGLIGLCLGGSLISLIEPLFHFLLIPLRRAHQQQIRQSNEEFKKRIERKSTKQLMKWRKEESNIFALSPNFTTSIIRQRNHLNSKNMELFRAHFQ